MIYSICLWEYPVRTTKDVSYCFRCVSFCFVLLCCVVFCCVLLCVVPSSSSSSWFDKNSKKTTKQTVCARSLPCKNIVQCKKTNQVFSHLFLLIAILLQYSCALILQYSSGTTAQYYLDFNNLLQYSTLLSIGFGFLTFNDMTWHDMTCISFNTLCT